MTMKKINLELEDQLSKDIGKIAKENGMSKVDWCVSAITLVRDKYLAKKAAEKLLQHPVVKEEMNRVNDQLLITGSASFNSEEIMKKVIADGDYVGKPNDVSADESGLTMKPLDETGSQPIPEYGQQVNKNLKSPKLFTFFMNDGGEQKITAVSVQEAMEQLGISENEYLDYTEA